MYNAAIAAANQAAAGQPGQQLVQVPTLQVADQQLAPFTYSLIGLAVLVLPGRPVLFVRDAITPAQVNSHRSLYINAILIQSRGVALNPSCAACDSGPGLRPFPECRRVPGHFGGCCGNCKWRDHAISCTARYNKDNDKDDNDSLSLTDSDVQVVAV